MKDAFKTAFAVRAARCPPKRLFAKCALVSERFDSVEKRTQVCVMIGLKSWIVWFAIGSLCTISFEDGLYLLMRLKEYDAATRRIRYVSAQHSFWLYFDEFCHGADDESLRYPRRWRGGFQY